MPVTHPCPADAATRVPPAERARRRLARWDVRLPQVRAHLGSRERPPHVPVRSDHGAGERPLGHAPQRRAPAEAPRARPAPPRRAAASVGAH